MCKFVSVYGPELVIGSVIFTDCERAAVNRLFANERAAAVGGYPGWGFVSLS